MVDSIVYDKKKIIPSCALLEGEYGVNGLFVGVPTLIGRDGIEEIIEVEMTEAEREGFQRSVSAVQKTVDEVNEMG
jgi:malate dehydrogenase